MLQINIAYMSIPNKTIANNKIFTPVFIGVDHCNLFIFIILCDVGHTEMTSIKIECDRMTFFISISNADLA